jgi:hypothetical protein
MLAPNIEGTLRKKYSVVCADAGHHISHADAHIYAQLPCVDDTRYEVRFPQLSGLAVQFAHAPNLRGRIAPRI